MTTLYPKFKEAILQANANLSSGTVKVLLVDTGAYTYGAGHEFLSDVAGASIISTSAALGTKTLTSGVFDAADTVFTAVSGVQCEAVIFYIDTGVAATSRLIMYSEDQSGLPITPNGQDINFVFDNGASKIFAL